MSWRRNHSCTTNVNVDLLCWEERQEEAMPYEG